MNLGWVIRMIGSFWLISEIVLAVGTRNKKSVHDRGSLVLLRITFTISFVTAEFADLHAASIPFPTFRLRIAALIFVIVGLAIRWTAIMRLGRLFTSNVAIQQSHKIITDGLYGYVRHPSYTGLLLAVLGLAISHHNWLSFLIIVVPITAAVLYRIHIEETALTAAFRQDYVLYSRGTKRLVPGVY